MKAITFIGARTGVIGLGGANDPILEGAFPLEPNLLTGFTFCFVEGRILFILCKGMDGTGREEGSWNL